MRLLSKILRASDALEIAFENIRNGGVTTVTIETDLLPDLTEQLSNPYYEFRQQPVMFDCTLITIIQ